MGPVSESKKQFDELGTLLVDMEGYLRNLEPSCQELLVNFQRADKSLSLEALTQIMEGLNYYQKLLKSAAVLLAIDFSESLCEKVSVSSNLDQLCQIFTSIFEAAENEDYSLLTDIIEYDLIPAITISQKMLGAVQVQFEERAI